jgi:hypothetical protein
MDNSMPPPVRALPFDSGTDKVRTLTPVKREVSPEVLATAEKLVAAIKDGKITTFMAVGTNALGRVDYWKSGNDDTMVLVSAMVAAQQVLIRDTFILPTFD